MANHRTGKCLYPSSYRQVLDFASSLFNNKIMPILALHSSMRWHGVCAIDVVAFTLEARACGASLVFPTGKSLNSSTTTTTCLGADEHNPRQSIGLSIGDGSSSALTSSFEKMIDRRRRELSSRAG